MIDSACRPSADRDTWRQWAATATRLVILVSTVGAIVLTAATAAPPVETVAAVDVQRYSGTWYEVARVPNRFQEKCESDVTATYRPLADGAIEVVNRCLRVDAGWDVAVGRATAAPGDTSGARLRVSFLPELLRWVPWTKGDYWVVMLDDDYRYSVVSDPQRRYLWILSRTPVLDAAVLEGVVSQLRERGYPVDQLVPTRQRPRAYAPASMHRTQLII